MVDIVVNHFAFSGNHANVDYSQYTPFNTQSDFHNFCFISNFDNQTDVEQVKTILGHTSSILIKG
jgi:alpha-amylase